MTLRKKLHRAKGRRVIGFTLVELLVVVAIIAILATLIITGLSRAQAKANQVHCLNNLKQLAAAFQTYTSSLHGGYLPRFDYGYWIGAVGYETGILQAKSRDVGTRTYVFGVYDWVTLGPGIRALFIPPREGDVFLCKSDTKALYSTIQGVKCSYVGISQRNYAHMENIKQPSRRILLYEAHQTGLLMSSIPGLAYEYGSNPRIMQRNHLGRANVLFCDFHVESVEYYSGADKEAIEQHYESQGDQLVDPLDIRYWEHDYIPPTSSTTSTSGGGGGGGGGSGSSSSSSSTTTSTTSSSSTTTNPTTSTTTAIYIGP